MDAKQFLEALDAIEAEKHISKEAVIEALKEALKKAYIKNVGAADEANVVVVIDQENAIIEIKHIKEVVDDDDEEDKSLQISLSDANKDLKKNLYKVGDEYIVNVNPDQLTRLAALAVRSILKQKLAEVEKAHLYELHKDNVGTLISGYVERCDEKGCIVTIDQTSFSLGRRDLIGDEMFKNGETIRMHLSEVSNGEKGPTLKLSRSDEGFLKCVIDEEVPDVHSGVVVIKKIVREAGLRSKVAVYSTNSQVDPVLTCIGRGSQTLKAICNRVGTSSTYKEKVNFVQYSDNILAYVADALRPANIISIGKETLTLTGRDGEPREVTKVIAIIGNEEADYKTACGARGANLRLASKLTGTIVEVVAQDKLEETDYEDIEFVSVEALRAEQKATMSTKVISQLAEQLQTSAPVMPQTSGAYIKSKPQQILDEDLVEETPVENVETPVAEETPVATSPVETKVEEVAVETKPVEEAPVVVKTTTTLESLEKSLETSKKKESFKGNTKRRPRNITEDEVEDETKKEVEVKKGPQMDIYTQEELAAMEAEEYEEEDVVDDVDYEDFEEYYDDEN